jgi:hypothetical protein
VLVAVGVDEQTFQDIEKYGVDHQEDVSATTVWLNLLK